MTQRNDFDLNTLSTEVGELKNLLASWQEFYKEATNIERVDKFVNSAFGSITWLITSFEKIKSDKPASDHDFIQLNALKTNTALLTSISTNQIPKLTSLINEFLKLEQPLEISQSQSYQTIKTECNNSLALLNKLDPIVKGLLTNAKEVEEKFSASMELKTDDSVPKNDK